MPLQSRELRLVGKLQLDYSIVPYLKQEMALEYGFRTIPVLSLAIVIYNRLHCKAKFKERSKTRRSIGEAQPRDHETKP